MNRCLAPHMVERPWGRDCLPAPFATPSGQRIGEIWFETPAQMDALLVKYIFTSQALSVQVHPDDHQARAAGSGLRGKEECWLVIEAQPGAQLGIGFREPLDPAAMRAAALDGSIEDLLAWHPVVAGDFFRIPPGTVHAIGAGIGLIEIQQNSDITYRLYDYGRPRELHLDAGMAVARGERYPDVLHCRVAASGCQALVDGPNFRVDRIDGAPEVGVQTRYRGAVLVLPLDGEAEVGCSVVRPGQCALAASLDDLAAAGRCLIAQPCA